MFSYGTFGTRFVCFRNPMSDQPSPSIVPESNAWRIVAMAMLTLLAVAAALLVPEHEPWFDEVQAWFLARDASPWDILWKYARYEGSPSLWHMLLTIPAKAGAPPMALNCISATLAVAGAALLLFRSPFPPYLRVLLPATYFFFYQYGIVARNYALLMPLLWLVAVVFPRRFEHPWRYVGMLMVVTQVSLHAAWIGGSLMLCFLWDAWQREKWPLARLVPFTLAFAVDTAVIIAQLWPPADIYGPPWEKMDQARVITALNETLFLTVLPWPVIAAAVLICAGCFFYTRGVLFSYLLSVTGLLALFIFRFYSVWHGGMIFALLILHTWLAWVSPVRRSIGSVADRSWPTITAGALTFTAIVQVYWSAMAGWHDWKFAYSGSREAAEYLRERGIDKQRIHAFKFATCAVLIGLDRNPFANLVPFMPGSFWVWTKQIFAGQTPAALVQGKPEWIMAGAQLRPAVDVVPPPLPGYALDHVFSGRIIWKDGFYRTDSYYLYKRVAP